MPFITVIFVLIVVGFLLYMLNRMVPMDGNIRTIINFIVVLGVLVWLAQVFGIIGSVSSIRVR